MEATRLEEEIPTSPYSRMPFNIQPSDSINQIPKSTRKRQRKLTPQGKLDAAATRKRGACMSCRQKKIKCSHAWQGSPDGETPPALLTPQRATRSSLVVSQQTLEAPEDICSVSFLPPKQGHGDHIEALETYNGGLEHAEAIEETQFGTEDVSWIWDESLSLDRNSAGVNVYSAEQFSRMLDTACDPFSQPLLKQIQSDQSSWTGLPGAHGSTSASMEQASLDDGAYEELELSQSAKSLSSSAILQSADRNKIMQRRAANITEEDSTASDEYTGAGMNSKATSYSRHIRDRPKDSSHSIKWPLIEQKSPFRKRRLDETTANMYSAPARTRRPCADNDTTTARTWTCCCGRSVLKSGNTSGQYSRNPWSSQAERNSAAARSGVAALSPGAVISMEDFPRSKDTDEKRGFSSHRKKMKVFFDPPSPTFPREPGAATSKQEYEHRTHVNSDLIDCEVASNPQGYMLAPQHSFASTRTRSYGAQVPVSHSSGYNPTLYEARDTCIDSAAAYSTSQNAPTPVTPSNINRSRDISTLASSFCSPLTTKHMQTPDLSFNSSPPAAVASNFRTLTPATTDHGYYGLSHTVDGFGNAVRRIDFGAPTAKHFGRGFAQEELNLDLDLFPADGADLCFDFDPFTS